MSLLLTFLEVSIHSILYARAIYPPTLFSHRRIWHTRCVQSRHPGISGYVRDVVRGLAKELEKGRVRRVAVVVAGGMRKKVQNSKQGKTPIVGAVGKADVPSSDAMDESVDMDSSFDLGGRGVAGVGGTEEATPDTPSNMGAQVLERFDFILSDVLSTDLSS
ncbi:hypothetical protein HDU93_009237 [Gonapodya sp. JEL0774]|nr:hypothetical protein HDU93_009237 [Gonapodya sp. JEL0774]